jgi:hypothetical protein
MDDRKRDKELLGVVILIFVAFILGMIYLWYIQ